MFYLQVYLSAEVCIGYRFIIYTRDPQTVVHGPVPDRSLFGTRWQKWWTSVHVCAIEAAFVKLVHTCKTIPSSTPPTPRCCHCLYQSTKPERLEIADL